MLREKEYIFLSLMIPQEIADEVKQYSSNNMADAANALEHNLMEDILQSKSRRSGSLYLFCFGRVFGGG